MMLNLALGRGILQHERGDTIDLQVSVLPDEYLVSAGSVVPRVVSQVPLGEHDGPQV
jgi:hypothetical protein